MSFNHIVNFEAFRVEIRKLWEEGGGDVNAEQCE